MNESQPNYTLQALVRRVKELNDDLSTARCFYATSSFQFPRDVIECKVNNLPNPKYGYSELVIYSDIYIYIAEYSESGGDYFNVVPRNPDNALEFIKSQEV